MSELTEKVQKIVLDQTRTPKEIEPELDQLYQEYRDTQAGLEAAFLPLQREGMLLPNSGDIDQCYYGSDDDEFHHLEQATEFAITIRSAILEELTTTPQTEIDALLFALSHDDDKTKPAIRKVTSRIKKVVHTVNPGSRCSVYYTMADESRDTVVEIDVVFSSNETDKKASIKASRFIVDLNGSPK